MVSGCLVHVGLSSPPALSAHLHLTFLALGVVRVDGACRAELLAGQEVCLALSHLGALQEVVPAAVVSPVVGVHGVGPAGGVGGLPSVLLDHVHGLVSDVLVAGGVGVLDHPAGLAGCPAVLRLEHDCAVVVFVLKHGAGPARTVGSLQGGKVGQVKTAPSLE